MIRNRPPRHLQYKIISIHSQRSKRLPKRVRHFGSLRVAQRLPHHSACPSPTFHWKVGGLPGALRVSSTVRLLRRLLRGFRRRCFLRCGALSCRLCRARRHANLLQQLFLAAQRSNVAARRVGRTAGFRHCLIKILGFIESLQK
jgi:hypothetical protein